MSFLKELPAIIKAAFKMLSRGWYNSLSERGKKSYETLGYVISKKIIEAVLFVAIMVFTVFAAEGFDNLMKIFNLQKKLVLVLAVFLLVFGCLMGCDCINGHFVAKMHVGSMDMSKSKF